MGGGNGGLAQNVQGKFTFWWMDFSFSRCRVSSSHTIEWDFNHRSHGTCTFIIIIIVTMMMMMMMMMIEVGFGVYDIVINSKRSFSGYYFLNIAQEWMMMRSLPPIPSSIRRGCPFRPKNRKLFIPALHINKHGVRRSAIKKIKGRNERWYVKWALLRWE